MSWQKQRELQSINRRKQRTDVKNCIWLGMKGRTLAARVPLNSLFADKWSCCKERAIGKIPMKYFVWAQSEVQ